MGEVYRAHDSRLGRDVAIKLLPAEFTEDAGRLARFETEARALAALNHPHIAAIYGIEDAGGVPALVLELVDGETLADRLQRGALSVTTALRLAREIADALDAAHRKGIVHRDLKPANIKITSDGGVKVLDFGLAKAVSADVDAAAGVSQSPTMAAGATHLGMIVGTAGYMSPEQARGLPVDTRSDIWAFGCVLYEMLAGRSPFAGATAAETLSAIFERQPDWSVLPSSTPSAARELLRGCLQKDVGARYKRMADARDLLDRVLRGSNRWKMAAVVTAAVALVAIAVTSLIVRRSARSGSIIESSEYQQLTDLTESARAPSLSADGRMVAFKVGDTFFLTPGDIYVKLLPNGESVPLTHGGPSPKFGPVFTPDGSRVAYSNLWDTYTVPVLGGEATSLLPNASGLTYLPDGRVLFAEIRGGLHMGIVSAQPNRAESRDIYFPPHQLGMAHFAHASPDAQSVLVVEMDQTHAFGLPCRLLPGDGASAGRTVGPNGTCIAAAWSPDGRWMYFNAIVSGRSHLWRQRYPDGEPEQITAGPTEEEGVAVAPDSGSLITALGLRRSSIWIHDRTGERSIVAEGYAKSPQLSADGRRLFFLVRTSGDLDAYELRVMNLSAGTVETVVPGTALVAYDISRDGTQVVFSTRENGKAQIWMMPADRQQAPRRLATDVDQMSFLPDGSVIGRSVQGAANTLVRIIADGTRREVDAPQVHEKGRVSGNGQWAIVYSPGTGMINSSKTFAVPVNGGSPRHLCSPYCDVGWSPDGQFFTIGVNLDFATGAPRSTLVIPVSPPWSIPDLPAHGMHAMFDYASLAERPGVTTVPHGGALVGTSPDTYVFTKTEFHTNLFRIPLKK
jgi:Tol biopolymer transport system component